MPKFNSLPSTQYWLLISFIILFSSCSNIQKFHIDRSIAAENSCNSLVKSFIKPKRKTLLRSEIVTKYNIVGFTHATVGIDNIVSILKLGTLLSSESSLKKGISFQQGHIDTGRKDFVYLSPRKNNQTYYRTSMIMDDSADEERYYVGKASEWSNTEKAIIKFPSTIIDENNFVHASDSWLYGDFISGQSYLPNELEKLFKNGELAGGEFIFQDELPIDFNNIEIWVSAHFKDLLLDRLKQLFVDMPALKKINWGKIIRSTGGTPIYDLAKLSNQEIISHTGNALKDLYYVDKDRALELALMKINFKSDKKTYLDATKIILRERPLIFEHLLNERANRGLLDDLISVLIDEKEHVDESYFNYIINKYNN